MKNLYSANVDQSTVDNLISGSLVPCKVVAVDLEQGQGKLPRGTLLQSEDGETYSRFMQPAAPDADAPEIAAVLMLDIDTDDPDECAGPAAFSGEFNQNKIEAVMKLELTPAEIAGGRARQIYIAPMEPAPGVF